MKTAIRVLAALVLTAAVAAPAFANPKGTPPGKADTFYRGVTTIAIGDPVVEAVTETTVLASATETRTIGNGQFNNGRDGNLQDRTVTTVQVDNYLITTVTYEQHHGVAHSNGKYLGTFEVVTVELISSEETTETGDWGPAYDVPSDSK